MEHLKLLNGRINFICYQKLLASLKFNTAERIVRLERGKAKILKLCSNELIYAHLLNSYNYV